MSMLVSCLLDNLLNIGNNICTIMNLHLFHIAKIYAFIEMRHLQLREMFLCEILNIKSNVLKHFLCLEALACGTIVLYIT